MSRPESMPSLPPGRSHLCVPLRTSCPAADRGFTLIEVLIAIALLSILLGSIYSAFFLSQRALEGMDESLVRLHESRFAVDTMRREVESLSYDPKEVNALFKIEDRDIYGRQASTFAFAAFSPLAPGLSVMAYSVEEREERLVLLKRMQSASPSPSLQDESVEVVEGLQAFLVEAKSGDQWLKTWDVLETKKIPEEIRITMTILVKDRPLSLSQTIRPRIGKAI